ncbi:MAG: pilin glycosylation ligase domain-containing protein, partial [Burkholderiales bacterium]|nr:pilin glycosylation ligase domain-containing protein [Burkholderiales bacterium]
MTRNSLLLSIAFAWAFAYLVVQHTLPVATFYGEWTAALMFALLACQLVFAAWVMRVAPAQNFVVTPKVWLFPQALIIPTALAAVLALQAVLGVGEQFWIGHIALLYAVAGMAVVCLAGYLRQLLGFPTLLLTLAWSGLAVGLIGSAIEILQAFKLEPKLFTLISQTGYDAPRRLYGNLNQPNHQATMVSMGLGALVYLYCTTSHCSLFISQKNQLVAEISEETASVSDPISTSAFRFYWLTALYIVCVPVLLIGMALTGSRTAWVHLSLALLMGLALTFRTVSYNAQQADTATRLSHKWVRVGLLLALPVAYWLVHALLGWASEQWQLGLFNTLSKFKESAQTGA